MARIKAKKSQAEVKLSKAQAEKVRTMLWGIAQRALDGEDVASETGKLTRKSFEAYQEILLSLKGEDVNSVAAVPSQVSDKREGLQPSSSKLSLREVVSSHVATPRDGSFFENIQVLKETYASGNQGEIQAVYAAVSSLKDNAHQALKAIDELKSTGHKVDFKTTVLPQLDALAEANALCAICWLLKGSQPSTQTFNYVAGRFQGETFKASESQANWLANLNGLITS